MSLQNLSKKELEIYEQAIEDEPQKEELPLQDILLSIKPKYVRKIEKGRKIWEFRKKLWSNSKVIDKIYLYETSPTQRIIGYFKTRQILSGKPKQLWALCSDGAGISKEQFFKYFKGHNEGYALKISYAGFFEKPIDPYEKLRGFHAPQNFMYITIKPKHTNKKDKSHNDYLNEFIGFKISKELKERIEEKAIESNQNISKYVRDAVKIKVNNKIKTITKERKRLEQLKRLNIKKINRALNKIAKTSASLSSYAYKNFRNGRTKGVISEFYETNESKEAFYLAYQYIKYLAEKGIKIHRFVEIESSDKLICQICGKPIKNKDEGVLHHIIREGYSKPNYDLYFFPKTDRHFLIPLHKRCHPKGMDDLQIFERYRYYKNNENKIEK